MIRSPAKVVIYDRKGLLVANINAESECLEIKWSFDGSTLAILLKSTDILFWNPIKGTESLETGFKGLDLLEWSLDDSHVIIFNDFFTKI